MNEFNPNSTNLRPKPKAPFVLFIVCIIVLAIVGGYLVYAKSLGKTTELANNEVTSQVAQSNNTVEDNSVTTNTTDTANTTDQSTAPTQTTRDPNRYYNDEDGYSFIVPERMEARPSEDVYPPDNIAKSHNLVIDTNIPESVRAGGSDWVPELSIVTSNDLTIDESEYEEIQVNKYNYLKKTDVIPEGEFWLSGEVYTYILLTSESPRRRSVGASSTTALTA